MVSILLASGFEETEAVVVYDVLKRGGVDVTLVSATGTKVIHGLIISVWKLMRRWRALRRKSIVC